MDLDAVLDHLHKRGQRATYSAVGGVVGRPARSVMQGQPKTARNSWVVAKENGLPTGYTTADIDPRLSTSGKPLATPEELRQWLRAAR